MKLTDRLPEKLRMFILRPLALFSFAFYVLLCFVYNVGGRELLPAAVLLFFVSTFFFVLFIAYRKSTKKKALFFALFMMFCGAALSLFTSYGNFRSNIEPYFRYDGKTAELSGTVSEIVWEKPYAAQYKSDIKTIDGEDTSVKILLYSDGGLSVGDKFTCDAELSLISDENGAPSINGYYGHYFTEGVVLSGNAEKVRFAGTDSSPGIWASGLREKLSDILVGKLGEDYGGFCSALLLGNRAHLPEKVHRDYSRIGVSHILAISGMHLAVICLLIQFLFRHADVRLSRIATTVTVIFYMVLTGFPASVARSGIMMLVLTFCQCLKKGSDTVTGIGLSAFLICIFDPFSAGDVGLKLSVASVFAIAVGTGKMTKAELKPLKPKKFGIRAFAADMGQALFAGVCVVIFILPLEWEYFGYMSPVSPLASVVLSFLSSLILYLLPLLLLLSPVKSLAGFVAFPVKLLCRLCFFISGGLSEISDICVSILFGFAFVLCAASSVLFLIWALSKKKTRIISGILCITVFVSLIGTAYIRRNLIADTADITLVNDKKNDAVVIDYDGKTTVIDIGNGYSPILTKAANATEDCGASEINCLILTHLHKPYTSTLASFFDRYMVRSLAVPDTAVEDEDDRETCEALREICREKKVSFESFAADKPMPLTENSYLLIYKHSYIKRSVQPSVRFDIILQDKTVTYIGSSYTEVRPATEFSCDVLLIGSHGPLYKKDFSADISAIPHIFAADYARDFLPFEVEKENRIKLEKDYR